MNKVDEQFVPRSRRSGLCVYLDKRHRDNKGDLVLEMLRRFHDRAPGQGCMIQSPQYVGCTSALMSDRWKAHDPQQSTYTGANFGLWLTMSCMRAAGVEPRACAYPIICTGVERHGGPLG